MGDVFSTTFTPDWEALRACIARQGTPHRVHHIELYIDWELEEAICRRFHLLDGLDADDPTFPYRRSIRIQRFLGYDYVTGGPDNFDLPLNRTTIEDTAALQRAGGRAFMNESRGPITTWEEFERYPWPDPAQLTYRKLEWYEKNLPDDMCVIGWSGFAHFAEHLTWLMGYETLCYTLYDDRELVRAIADRVQDLSTTIQARVLEFERVKIIWGSDDMGFKTGPLIGPNDLREFALPGHKQAAEMSHAAGKLYILHSCGNLETIMEDLIEDVRIDGKHSFEDTIEDVRDTKRRYGERIALLGGIDVDFLCRADEAAIRARVRDTLDVCMPGGGYCLGTGNTAANYIPMENYLAMLDEGRRYAL